MDAATSTTTRSRWIPGDGVRIRNLELESFGTERASQRLVRTVEKSEHPYTGTLEVSSNRTRPIVAGFFSASVVRALR
jgi:hypothetical protein